MKERETSETYLHLVHALAGVPVQERLALEHGRELVVHTLEQLLDGGRVGDERYGHLAAARRDVTVGREHVVRDPLDKVRRVGLLDLLHLLLDVFHGDLATEDGSDLAMLVSIPRFFYALGWYSR
jgi:hypothetical protein